MTKINYGFMRLALPTCAAMMLASCTTSQYAKVQTVVPESKPGVEETAMLNSLSSEDTSGTGVTETADLQLKPVDFATNAEVAMAYAVPTPKPVTDAELAIGAASAETQIASVETAADPVVSASAALVEVEPKTRSIEPFVTATKNPDLNNLIAKYAALYDVPERLVHHVVRRESNYNPGALHRGNWGLMQIRYNTARGMGYRGDANGLLDAETNLKYAVKYLRGAWLVADRNEESADWLYRTGYYYKAKAKGLLYETGLKQ